MHWEEREHSAPDKQQFLVSLRWTDNDSLHTTLCAMSVSRSTCFKLSDKEFSMRKEAYITQVNIDIRLIKLLEVCGTSWSVTFKNQE